MYNSLALSSFLFLFKCGLSENQIKLVPTPKKVNEELSEMKM